MSDWIEVNLPFSRDWINDPEGDSFSDKGLANPGTLIRLENGKEYLIGHINELGGDGDYDLLFGRSAIVKAYKVVWVKE